MARKRVSRSSWIASGGAVASAFIIIPGAWAQAQDAAPAFVIPPADLACILPGNRVDLKCLIANDPDFKRIRAEEAGLFSAALVAAKSGTLDPFHQIETLGKLEIFDTRLSVNNNLACSFCHDPAAGYGNGASILSVFTGGSNPGSVPITVHGAYPDNRIAKRNPQSYVYAAYFPPLQFNPTQGDFYGGNFWDARATGYRLHNSAAEQAQDPPVDPEEMANPDTACVVWKIATGPYNSFFEQVWGPGSLSSITWPGNVATICATPKGAASLGGSATPLALSATDRTRANQAYDEFGQAIAAYEISVDVSPFTSKFDLFLSGEGSLTAAETRGYNLFRGKAQCNTCHLDGRSNVGTAGAADNGEATNVAPMFTDFTYNNIGLPRNPRLPWYFENTPDQTGFTGNPLGIGFTDTGVGLFLSGYYGPPPNLTWGQLEPFFEGKFQTSTLRDTAKLPYPGFVKAYMHNGYLQSLKEVVHFYNTRDTFAKNVLSGHCPAGTVEKVTCWPKPEDPNNMNLVIGKLGLSAQEEDDLVTFLTTLNDGFVPITPEALARPAVQRKPTTPPPS